MQILITVCLRIVHTVQNPLQLLIYKGKTEREIPDLPSALQLHSSHLFHSLWKLFAFLLELHSDWRKPICSENSVVCLSDISANFILLVEVEFSKYSILAFLFYSDRETIRALLVCSIPILFLGVYQLYLSMQSFKVNVPSYQPIRH